MTRHTPLALTLGLLSTLALGSPMQAQAQPTDGPANAEAQTGSRFGLGFQSSWPAYGVSALYDVSDRFTAQAVLGALGAVTSFSGRGLYYLTSQPKYRWFGFGTVGLWRYDYTVATEGTVGVGGGAGVELNWKGILTDGDDSDSFPPLFSTIDLGFTMASFDHYNWSALTWGLGLHYRF